jgi:ferredoxin
VTVRIRIEPSRCEGFGNCINAAPDIFDMDDEGRVILKLDTVDDSRVDVVRRAVYDCPVNVISFTQE